MTHVPLPHVQMSVAVHQDERAAFAHYLLSARQRAGRSLPQIAEETKISIRHLESLECGHLEKLPAGLYRRAIVRSYAACVGLDPASVLERCDAALSREVAMPDPARATPATLPLRPAATADGWWQASERFLRSAARSWLATSAAVIALAIAGYAVVPRESHQGASAPSPTGRPGDAQRAAVSPIPSPAPPAALDPSPGSSRARDTGGLELPPGVSGTTGAVVGERQTERVATAPEHRLVVTSQPSGARVTINGVGWGVTPLTIPHLPEGDKIIRVTKDGFIGRERRVTVPDATEVRVVLQPRG